MLSSYRFSVCILLTSIIIICECGSTFYNENEYESCSCETKLYDNLSSLQNEIFRKLNAIDQKISDNAEATKRRFDALESMIPTTMNGFQDKIHRLEKMIGDSEENSREQFRKLERTILNNLEEYIQEKLNSTEKRTHRKIDALENIMPDKSDIDVLNHKLDAFSKNLLDSVLPLIPEAMSNRSMDKRNDKTNRCVVDENSGFSNTSAYFEELNRKVSNIEESLNNKWTELKQIIPELSENITSRLLALDTTVQSNSRENNLGCNKVVAVRYDEYKPLLRMDNETLKHVIFRSGSDGLTYFEMHFAVKAGSNGIINLSSGPNPGTVADAFEIDIGGRANTWTHMHLDGANKIEVNTPQILSSTEFKAFYLKIKNGSLELGKEKSSTPTLGYSDARLKNMKYFSFSTYVAEGATFLYDCPPNVDISNTA